MKMQRTTLTAMLVAVPVLLLVGACSAGDGSASEDTGASGSGGSKAVAPGTAQGPDTGKAAGDSGSRPEVATPGKAAPAVAALDRAIVATGQVSLHAASLLKARAEVLRLTTRWGGVVADEQTNADDKGRITDSTITLRVPTPRFSEAMNAIGGLGKVEQTSRSTEDVTTQVIDNAARIRAAERSIAQIERLLSRAQHLSDIITIESDLARRQADLDSLKQQQAWLADQTSLSTINVYLSRAPGRHHEAEPATGFLAGITDGWHALGASTVVVLQVVGAVLPFGVALLLLGAPLVWWVRRHRPVAAPPAPTEA
jgi:hypothetical protein